MSIAENYFIQENGSDSETNSEDDGSDYYQPVSAIDDTDNENEDEQQQQQQPIQNSDSRPNSHNNGFVLTEPRVDSLDLNDEINDNNEEEEEEREREEREREAAMRTAFREDENRRNAPLGQENAVRIMEAMRQISFAGFEPDWANRVPEDRWVHQLTTLRQSPTTSSICLGKILGHLM